jgi:hypothetical protein
VKAVSSTTKNRANNDDDESREDTNDDDSNSVDARKRNGKPSSTDAGASGKNLFNIYNLNKKIFLFYSGDPDESGDYDEEDDENSEDDGRSNKIS